MKKVLWFLGIVFLFVVAILNFIFTANLDASEHISIGFNSFIYIIGLVLMIAFVYFFSKIVDKYLYSDTDLEKKKNFRKFLFIACLSIYIIASIIWIILVRPAIVGDQIHACNLAQTFYRGDDTEFLSDLTYAGISLSEYMQAYHQQISLAFVFSLFFRLIHFDGIGILRVLNVISNVAIIFALYKINVQLSEKYKTNKVLLFTLILTFFSLFMLSTFIYGDFPSLALCLFSVYFMMKYTSTRKIAYPIAASVFSMFAYMFRMNSLIFVIATVIYLLLDLFSKDFFKKTWKENLLKISIIIIYICISLLPSSLVKSYLLNKYDLDKNKEYPNISYFLMAMQEAPRGNGWYNEEIGEYALQNGELAKTEYFEKIKDRLTYFSQNIGYTFNFYTMKVASMWCENTYSAVRNNTVKENDPLENIIVPLTFYQKALLILTCLSSLIVLIQNRKNISIDILFLVTIFLGGFAFHILWEAKSRYILPYVIILIPLASVKINEISLKKYIKKNNP